MSQPRCFAQYLKPERSGGLDGQPVVRLGLLSLILFSVKNKVMGPGKLLSE